MNAGLPHRHSAPHAFTSFHPRVREGLTVFSRRSMLKASLAGLAGLSLPALLSVRQQAATAGTVVPSRKAVIHHFGIPLDRTYSDHQGRPIFIVDNGSPIRELI
jgi:hypothetical protein